MLDGKGFQIVAVNDGVESFRLPSTEEATTHIVGVDEAWLYVKQNGGNTLCLYLVLGNEPGVIVNDYTVDTDLDDVTEAHYAKWENVNQPTKVKVSK